MKRFHVHVSVHDIAQSIRFYSTLFGSEPSVVKNDYAKWMLDDPRINFAISQRAFGAGVDHLGLQVDSGDELAALEDRLERADASMVAETDVTCCYAKSDKYWVTDPQGVAWEAFHTLGSAPTYGGGAKANVADVPTTAGGNATPDACCAPAEATVGMPVRAKKPAAASC